MDPRNDMKLEIFGILNLLLEFDKKFLLSSIHFTNIETFKNVTIISSFGTPTLSFFLYPYPFELLSSNVGFTFSI